MTPDEKEALYELLDAVREERITDEQFAHLRQLMHHNAEAEELYVEYMVFCADLKKRLTSFPDDILRLPLEPDDKNEPSVVRDLQQEEQPDYKTQQAQLDEKLRVNKIKQGAEETLLEFNREEQRREEERLYREYLTRRRQRIVGITSFAALVAIFLFVWLAPRSEPIAQPVLVEQPVVAVVSHTSNVELDNSPGIRQGAELKPGLIELSEGFVEITFKSEAEVILEGPAVINLINEKQAFLALGILTSYVPVGAQGFVIKTPAVQVTDLGTQFGLIVNKNGATDVHVLEGSVETTVVTTEPNEPLALDSRILNRDEALRFNADTRAIDQISIDEEHFARSWEDVLYKPAISGPIVFEASTPPSLAQGVYEDDECIHLFLERRDVTFTYPIEVDIVTPGRYQSFTGHTETIPVGERVDSYLLHWDPASGNDPNKMVSGRLIFRRPILGLITDAKRLAASDAAFGHDHTVYANPDASRGLDGDTVVLSPDRLILEVTLDVLRSAIDETRVLVRAATDDEQ